MKNSDINVFIIEDDRSAGLVISESIKKMGMNPQHFIKTDEALQVARIKDVHLAIIDVLLPKSNGVDLALEFRKTRFGQAPIILVSGIFKDKQFAQEAMKKSGAVDFLFKPFGYEELSKSVLRALEQVLTNDRWSVGSLLTSRLSSPREKVKAIEKLGPIEGFHFPVVLATLADPSGGGHLNIVDSNNEIYGLKIAGDQIVEVDFNGIKTEVLKTLVETGYLVNEDLAAAEQEGGRGYESLIEQGLVSPHALRPVKTEQILKLLDMLASKPSFSVNFVPGPVSPASAPSPSENSRASDNETSAEGLSMTKVIDHMKTKPELYFPSERLEEFYRPVLTAPVRAHDPQNPPGDPDVAMMVVKKMNLEEIQKISDRSFAEILLAVHIAFISKEISFDDMVKVKSLDALRNRFERLLSEFHVRGAREIFEYFGASGDIPVEDVVRIYKEYSEANHPDILPPECPAEIRSLCQKCFVAITEAYELLSSESRREDYEKDRKAQQGQRRAYVHALIEEGLEMLRLGQAHLALATFREADKILPSPKNRILGAWAEINLHEATPDRERVLQIVRELDRFLPEDKKSHFYFMVMGLAKKALGDPKAAAGFFEKALQLDPRFGEARRELTLIQEHFKANKKVDLLTGDLGEVVSQIFRRRKG